MPVIPKLNLRPVARKSIVISLIFSALLLLLLAHIFPVSDMDAQVSVMSSTGVLDAKLYLYGFDVKAGVEGGMLGGSDIRNQRFYVQGPGPHLPERLGMLMNSYKEKTYVMTAEVYSVQEGKEYFSQANISVSSKLDRVPIWVDGVEQTCTITISVNGSNGMERVDIHTVWIERWSGWSEHAEEKDDYIQREIVWEADVEDTLSEAVPSITYTQNMEYGSSDERVGFVARVNFTMTDVNGMTDEHPRTPFKTDNHPNPHNIYGVTHYNTLKVGLMALVFPMFMVVVVLCIYSVVAILRNKTPLKPMFASGVLVGLGGFFFWWGIETLVDILSVAPSLDLLAERYFSWNWPVYLLIPSSALLLFCCFWLWLVPVNDPEQKC